MPDFYAHLYFCRAVSQLLPQELSSMVGRDWDAYCCGSFGPDPLYFYHLKLGREAVRQIGLDLHHDSGGQALAPYRAAIRAGKPHAAAFAAGYLCHFLLDSKCHPYVHSVVEGGDISHLCLEAEFDKLLLRRDGLSYRQALPVRALPPAFYETAALLSPELTAAQYEQALRRFRWVSCKLGDFHGTPVHLGIDFFAGRIGSLQAAKGIILAKKPSPTAQETNSRMLTLLEEAIEAGPGQLEAFFDAVERDAPFPAFLDRNFNGELSQAAAVL